MIKHTIKRERESRAILREEGCMHEQSISQSVSQSVSGLAVTYGRGGRSTRACRPCSGRRRGRCRRSDGMTGSIPGAACARTAAPSAAPSKNAATQRRSDTSPRCTNGTKQRRQTGNIQRSTDSRVEGRRSTEHKNTTKIRRQNQNA